MGPRLNIGTRGSQLALWQAEWVRGAIRQAHPTCAVGLTIIKTRGDKILDVPLARVGGKGPPEFFSTHPSPANREKKLAEYVPEMMPYYEQKVKRPSYKLQ